MKPHRLSRSLRAALLVSLAVLLLGVGNPSDEGVRLDTWTLATRLVDSCAGIREGDIVLVTGNPRDLRLLEDLYVRIREVGAFPVVSLNTDRMTLRSFERMGENVLARTSPFEMRIAESITAIISIDSRESIDLLSGINATKLDAAARAGIPVDETMQKRNVRVVSLGNDLYPTADRARKFGLTLDELNSVFWDGVNIDPTRLRTIGETLRSKLASGKSVHITKPNGTDVTFGIEGRKAFISAGVISDEDAQKGGPACQVWLPAGEVYMTVAPGTANGKIVCEQLLFNGMAVKGLTLILKKGKVTDIDGTSGIDAIKQQLAIAGEGKDLLSFIDIGINPSVVIPPGSTIDSWVTAGMVSIGIGNNSWIGGDNKSTFSLALHITGTTTTIDNTPIVERGHLTVGSPLAELPLTTTSQQAKTHFMAGLQLWEHMRTIEARPHIEQTIAADPNFAMAYWLKSQASPTFTESDANITRALSLAGNASEGERLWIQATRAGLDGNTLKQEELLRRVVSLYPEDKRALLALGGALWTERRLEEARTVLRKAIAIDEEYAPAYNLLGYVNMNTGNLTDAERIFKKYVTLVPNEPNSHDSYAELLMKMGKYDASIGEYEKAVSLDDQFFSSRIGLAYDYAFKGQFADARRQLQAIDNISTDPDVRTQVIDASTAIALHEGRYDRALEAANRGYDLAVKTSEPRWVFHYQTLLGDITLEANAVDKTKPVYLKSRNAESAKLHEAASHFTEARLAGTQTTLPEETRTAYEQALLARDVDMAIRSDDLATAKRTAEKYRQIAYARKIKSEIETSHELAGIIAVAENKLQDAVMELNRSNLHDPRNLYRLVEVYDALGDKVMANDVRQRIAAFNETGINYAFVRRMSAP
jgi:aminopeptidase